MNNYNFLKWALIIMKGNLSCMVGVFYPTENKNELKFSKRKKSFFIFFSSFAREKKEKCYKSGEKMEKRKHR